VVGWLVCIDGPDKGTDYRIHAAFNHIGRAPTMQICIAGDDQISRDTHALIAYDPRGNEYTLAPGTAKGLVYHARYREQEKVVFTPVTLQRYDTIRLGASLLVFIPFLGDWEFRWV